MVFVVLNFPEIFYLAIVGSGVVFEGDGGVLHCGEYGLPCEGGFGAGVDGDEFGIDERVFAPLIALDVVFQVVGTGRIRVAGIFEG